MARRKRGPKRGARKKRTVRRKKRTATA